MKSPTQQAIIFLLEEYLKQYEGQYQYAPYDPTPEETKARELLEEIKNETV